MHESGARDLELIEQSLLADDPQLVARFEQAAVRLTALGAGAPADPILVAVDGTLNSLLAVRWAATIARESCAEIRIVHACRWRSYPTDYGFAELHDHRLLETGQSVCSAAVDLASAVAPRSRVHAVLVAGPAGAAIVHAAKDAALVVLGSARPSMLRGLADTSTLSCVVRRLRCAVAVVPTGDAAAAQALTSPVTVAVDGSAGDGPALAQALQLTDLSSRDLLVVSTAEREQAAARALAAAARRRPGLLVHRMVAAGSVVDKLADLSSSSQTVVCDRSLVALHRPGRGGAGRRLVREAACPVLLTSGPGLAGRH